MPKTLRRSEQGKADSAWLENLLKNPNPNVSITDVSSGQKVTTEELKDLVHTESAKNDYALQTPEERRAAKLKTQVEEQRQKDQPPDEQKREAEQEKQQQQHQKDLAEQKPSAAKAAKKLSGATKPVNRVVSSINDKMDQPIQQAGHALDVFAAAKTPGGIGFLVILLIFLMFVVVRVDQRGTTRIKQFWYMLNGKAHIDKSALPADVGTIQNTTTGPGNQQSNGSQPASPGDIAGQVIQDIPPFIEGVTAGIFPGLNYSADSFRTGGPM